MAEEHIDPFMPTLREAVEPHALTGEQAQLIERVLELASSDTRFAQKASQAIRLILAGGQTNPSSLQIDSLVPNQKGMGSQSFLLRVLGSGYDATCVIWINDVQRATTFVSSTEVRTNVSLVDVTTPNVYPVIVKDDTGGQSNVAVFTVTAG